MKVSIDWDGCYLQHKPFFDEMARSMIAAGNEVGILTGERDHKRQQILQSLGFVPSFIYMWGNEETITNGYQWKAEMMAVHDIAVHFDDDAVNLKMWTPRWVMKVMNNADINKF